MPRFKLDENLPAVLAGDLRQAGYDAVTVVDEGLVGSTDPDLMAKCQSEGRAMITLDLDFSDIRAYPPDSHAGIVILRPSSQSVPEIRKLFARLLPTLKT